MKSRAVQRKALAFADKERMYLLLRTHFSGVDRDIFEEDLGGKNWVILIENDEGRLMGFSTFLQSRTSFEGQRYSVIFSGDTIMDPAAWGTFALPKMWIKTVRRICAPIAEERVVWLLITSGFRTYRFLPVFWKEFYPRHDIKTPAKVQRLMAHLSLEQFAEGYSPDCGIVRFEKPHSLVGYLADIPEGKLQDPHVQFFLKMNPGHMNGDELVCYADLGDDNLTSAGRRMVGAKNIAPEVG